MRGATRQILEIQNANRAYERAGQWDPLRQRSLLLAHAVLMQGLAPDAGRFRTGQVGVLKGERVAHPAPLGRLSSDLRGKPETPQSRIARARHELGRSWFSRKHYLALFPRLSTASASRDLAQAVAAGELTGKGERALKKYRFG